MPPSEELHRRADGAASAEVDGDTVVLSPSDFRYHALNATAGAIWDALESPRTTDAIVEILLDRFDVDATTCRTEVDACLVHLAQIGVVVTS